MAYSRNEYLQSLNRMRANYQNQGNPLINREDDNGNVGTELSAFAYMDTQKQLAEQVSNPADTKSKRNGYQRTLDTIHAGISNVTEGVTNFLDDVWDFAVVSTSWLTGLFSGIGNFFGNLFTGKDPGKGFQEGWEKGTSWTQPLTTFEWEQYLNNWWNQMDIGHAVLSGDVFTGEWEKNWGRLGDKGFTKEVHQNSWTSENEKVAEWEGKIGQGIGYILPSLVVAYFSGGASVGAQIGIQAGIAGGTALGGAFEKATKEGASYGQAMGYGAIKGGISAGLTALTMGIGGNVASKAGTGVGGKIVDKVVNKGGSVIAGKIAEAGFRVSTSAGQTALMTAVEPLIQGITYDADAIEKAYGNNEAVVNTLKTIGENALTSAVITASVSAGRLAVDVKKAGGVKGLEQKYWDNRVLRESGMDKDIQTIKNYNKSVEKLQKQLINGKISEQQFVDKVTKLNAVHGEALQSLNKHYEQYFNGNSSQLGSTRYSLEQAQAIEKADVLARDVATSSPEVQIATMAKQSGMSNEQVKQTLSDLGFFKEGTKNFTKSGNTDFTYNSDNGDVKLVTTRGSNIYSATLANEGGNRYIVPNNPASIDKAMGVLAYNTMKGSNVPTTMQIKSSDLKVPNVEARDINTSMPLKINQDVSTKILNNPAKKDVLTFLKSTPTISKKNNYVLKPSDGKYMVVEQFSDDGKTKYGLITVNSKTNEITDISVSNTQPDVVRYTVVPKQPSVESDYTKIATTKLESKDGVANRYVMPKDQIYNELGGWTVTPATSTKEPSFFVYAKNPLRETEMASKLSFAKMAKRFNIPKSLEKTYLKKLESKNPLSVLQFISRYAKLNPQEIMAKLGYDVFEYKDGNVVVTDGSRFIGGNIKYGETKGANGYSSLVKRIGRESTNEKLQGYIGKNGRELETQSSRQEYKELVLDNNAYKEEYVNNRQVAVIDDKAYSKDMLQIVDNNTKLGATTRFIIDVNDKFFLTSGFYNNDGTIYLILNNDPRTLTTRNEHEVYHYLDDFYHVSAISNVVDLLHTWKAEYPQEYNRVLDQYKLAYRGKYNLDEFFENMIENELLAEIYCKDIVLENQDLQQRIIDTVNMVAGLGKEKADQIYYKFLDKDNFKPMEVKTRYSLDNGYKVGKPGEASVGIAITYELTSTSTKDILANVSKYKSVAMRETKKIADMLGLKITQTGAIGGWTWTDNANITTLEGEPSFPVHIDGYNSIEDVKLFASLLADTAMEVQNSVGVFEYSDTGKDVEDTFFLEKIDDKLFDIIKSSKVEGFTLSNKEKRLVIAGASDDIIDTLIKGLKNGGYLNEKHEATHCNIYWLGLKERADLYKVWLKNNVGKENGSLYARVKQAQQVNNYVLSNLDKDGKRLPETLSKSSDILSHLRKTEKIISDLKAKSSNVLIEAGADVSKSTKVRLKSVQEAFNTAIAQVIPDNGTFKLNFGDTKQSFAELNLAKPKDRAIAIDNLMKRLNNTEITLVTTLGEDKVRLGDLLTVKQEQQARDIMLATLNGKAEPTKLANWVKSLQLAKMETIAVKDHIKLVNRFERRIDASSHLNFGYGNAPVAELTVFKNILDSVPRFWDNKGVLAFADSVLANYNDTNIKPLLDQCGVMFDANIPTIATNLKALVVPGKHLDPRVQMLADGLLRLLYNNLENVDVAVKSENVKQAEYDANVIQSMGNGRKHDGKISGTVKKMVASVDNSVTSTVDYLNRKAPGTNLTKFVTEETGEYENKEIELNQKYEDLLFRKLPTKEVKKLINKKFVFKGEKISYGVALDRLNDYKTLGDKFFLAKGAKTNPDSTRKEVVYTPQDIADLEKAIPQALLDYNEKVLEVLNKELKADIKALYKYATHTDLMTLDDGIWYNIARVSDSFFGVNMGGVSMRDFNLSMFNQRVNSRADLNFDLDLQSHIRAYLNKAFKVLVWTPYMNKLNTLLNTRVYGVTNYKIYQENLIGFDKQIDMLVHQVLGVPFETKVSTMSRVAGKVVGNLNAVRVATIQAGWRTVSSAPMFAKYFGAKTALQGQLQNLKNGDLLAFNKNYKIIKQYSPYLAKRFTSVEVALAETGVKVANKIMKVTGMPLRFGDASIHLTLGFAMAQVQAQKEGYGAPYTDSNNKRASYLLEQASKSTQPTNAIGRVAGFRYGNSVSKYLFGLYGSMKQVFYDALVAPIEDIVTTKPRINAMENAIKEHEAKIDEYGKLADEARDRMNNATTDEEFKEAEKDYEKYSYKKQSHEKAKKNTEDNLNDFKRTHTGKKLFNRLSGALGGFMFASLMYVAIRHAISVLEGKKSVKDFTVKDFTVDVAEQAFMNSLPYLSTLYASIKNNSDLSIATLDNLNNTVDAVKKLIEAIESGNGGHITGSTWNLLKEVSQYFGIPLSAMVRLVNGAWYNIDKGSNLDFHNWLGMLSASKLRSNYNNAVKNGDKQTAIANLEVWTNNNSIKTSENVLEEIYRLNEAGETGVAPSAIPTKYTNEKGDEVKLTKAQINAFRNEYSKADQYVSKLLEIEDYKKQDDKTKASLIKRVYSAYREVAQAKVLGISPTSKLGKLLYYTNGDIDMARYIMSLQNLSVITEDKKHTRKENVISAINKMSGFTKKEKLLLAYLSGYSVSEKNQKTMVRFLRSKGFDTKTAKTFLGLDKK